MKHKLLLMLLPLCLTTTSCEISINFPSFTSQENVTTFEYTSDEESTTEESEDVTSISSTDEEETSKEEWSLLWGDEFEGDSLDTRYWNYQIGNGNGGWGNQEIQYYQEQNVIVEDGELTIRAKRESVEGFNFTSSRINTKNKISTTYGKIEAKIALPAEQGMWPAFWMLPEANYENQYWPHAGEIDIMEAKGRVPNSTSGALHFSDNNNKHTFTTSSNVFTLNAYTNITEYHVYGVIWNADSIEWYCDGNTFMTIKKENWHTQAYGGEASAPFNQEFHILLNMAIGGTFDNYVQPSESFTSADMKVDYVRIYKHND